ncbi:hypothetical protein Ct61P_15084 [Colletotrichum tofieldiae]|nr:hypothetical protein Ct61P_15084 [Colletotrichum tofieldiae]
MLIVLVSLVGGFLQEVFELREERDVVVAVVVVVVVVVVYWAGRMAEKVWFVQRDSAVVGSSQALQFGVLDDEQGIRVAKK